MTIIRLLNLTVWLGCVLNGYGQTKQVHDVGSYTSIQWFDISYPVLIPQVWAYYKKAYAEVRYNYEDSRTTSLYFGRPFHFGKKWEAELIPMLGGVIGQTNGLSPGFNFDGRYMRFSTFSQCQYTVDMGKGRKNFFWDWTGFTVQVSNVFGVGGSAQLFIPTTGRSEYNFAPMVSVKVGACAFETYVYNPWDKSRMVTLGIEYPVE